MAQMVKNPPTVQEMSSLGQEEPLEKEMASHSILIFNWQPIPVFLAGKSHGQRSLVYYSLWDCKELDMTE